MYSENWYEKYEDAGYNLYEKNVMFDRLVLPGLDIYSDMAREGCESPDEVIRGILRKRRKMLLSGPSKSAKSCLLMELAIALTEGTSWMGFPCKKSNVLYINLELDRDTAFQRFERMFRELGIKRKEYALEDELVDNLTLWNMRGYTHSIQALAKPIAFVCMEKEIDVVIIDPIYKVLSGDENSAGEIGRVCNTLDWIAREGDCAVIFSHHHSKGVKGNKQVLDRSSGSGVFGRDPDAILDLIQLDPSAAAQERMGGRQTTAWRIEAVLREFPAIEPLNCWFRFPIHIPDTEGLLDESSVAGSRESNLTKSSKRVPVENRKESFNRAYAELSEEGRPVKIDDMAKKMGVSKQTVRNRYKDVEDEYWLDSNMIGKLIKSA